jgi:hypothetical protein
VHHTNAFVVQILGGGESKKEWVLKALERRLEKEKKIANLRVLKLEYFDFFCSEFCFGGKKEFVKPVYIKFATLMRDLIALNCWSSIVVDADLPCECYTSLSQWFCFLTLPLSFCNRRRYGIFKAFSVHKVASAPRPTENVACGYCRIFPPLGEPSV